MTFFIDFIIAFALSSTLIPLIGRAARKKGLFDGHGERKIHSGKIPRLGGVGIFWGFLAAIVVTIFTARFRHGESFPELRFWAFVVAGSGFHALGFVDDLRNLDAKLKFLVQFTLAILVVIVGYGFKSLDFPGIKAGLGLGWAGPVLTVLWIVGIANAQNLLDGMDGMAGGVAFIGFAIWAEYYMKDGQYLPVLVAIAGAGATLGFLFYNFPPASIFMGDSGSLFLGYLLAMLPLLGGEGSRPETGLLPAITVCLLPILDTLAAILRRWRWKVSFFTPDKYHLHHKLLDLGMSNRQILAFIYSTCAAFGATVLASVYVDRSLGFAFMLASWGGGAILFTVLHFLKERHTRLHLAGEDANTTGNEHE